MIFIMESLNLETRIYHETGPWGSFFKEGDQISSLLCKSIILLNDLFRLLNFFILKEFIWTLLCLST